ncbi:MAG: DinB family protein [Acidobacteriota bacterium]|nr:DinB family protein [Acidobacteriota bacterium]MDH3523346.1 DinB family protein [Acidobacteriota bacterium]
MIRKRTVVRCAFAVLLAALPALAQEEESQPGAYARNLAFAGGRAVELAEAIPAEDWGWRPMEGVRSVSETVMHLASADYFFASRLGVPVPEGVDPEGMEAITDKAECIAALEAGNAQLAKAFDAVADPAAAMDIFGREGTVEDMMLVAIGHVHEHLGQLIAYARSNEVVPPWSRGDG